MPVLVPASELPRPGRLRPWWARLPAGLLLAAAVLLQAGAPAGAHAILESTTPGIATQVNVAPAEVTLRFSEAVAINAQSVQVFHQDGAPLRTGVPEAGAGPGTVTVTLPPGLAKGSYVVVWHVVSADSHPIAGTFSFGFGVPPGATSGEPAGDRPVVLLMGGLRLLAYAGVVALIGTVFFLLALWRDGIARRRPRRLAVTGWALSVLAAAGLLVLQGPFGAGRGLGGLADPGLYLQTLSSRFGHLLVARLVVLAAIAGWAWWVARPGAALTSRTALAPGLVLGLALVATFTLAGHPAEDSWAALTTAADIAHLGAASIWLGGLLVLVSCLLVQPAEAAVAEPGTVAVNRAGSAVATLPALGQAPPPDFTPLIGLLPRWSRIAMISVIVLVTTGTFQAWRMIRSVPALTGTDYGQLLLFKLYGVVVVLVLAASARSWVQRHTVAPAVRPTAASVRTMRLSVGAEAVLGIVVLALTAALVATSPARQSYGPPFSTTVNGAGVDGTPVVIYLDIGPTRVGSQTVYLSTHNTAGYVLPFTTVTLTLTQPGSAALRFPLGRDTAAGYAAGQIIVPKPGRWSVTVEMTTPDDNAYAGSTTFEVH